MIISIASGKGGTGKTTIAVNLVLSISNDNSYDCQFLDCDVEEPNAAIFLKPNISQARPVSILEPRINFTKCTFCGKCAKACAFNAIAVLKNDIKIFMELCHGCGGCSIACPENAISEVSRDVGVIESGNVGKIEFIQGKLNIGEAITPPIIIREMKKRIKKSGTEESKIKHITIIDAPPGTSCPVVESVKNSDFTILVTEPTPFGLNDLILAVEVLKKLNIPMGVVINRGGKNDNIISDYCQNEKIPILMRIPMDKDIAVAYSKGIPMIQINPKYSDKFKELYYKIENQLQISGEI